MDSRRDFIRKAGGLGLLAFGGCRCSAGRVRGDAVSPNYWCTWGIQNRMLGKVKRSPLAFAGDQGAARARGMACEDRGLRRCWNAQTEDDMRTED